MIKLKDLIKELQVSQPIKFVATSPRYGYVHILGDVIEYEINNNEKSLTIYCGYDWDVLKKFGNLSNNDADDEDYYPEEESKLVCKTLIKYFLPYGAKIITDSYNVSNILLSYDKVKARIQSNLPKYVGNYTFEWKGNKIRFERAPELDGEFTPGGVKKYSYKIYDSKNNLIDTIFSPNGNIDSYMRYQEAQGTSEMRDDVAYFFKKLK